MKREIAGQVPKANRRFVLERTSNEAKRMSATRRMKRSKVCEDDPVTFVEYVRAEIIGSNRAVENVSASRVYRLDGTEPDKNPVCFSGKV